MRKEQEIRVSWREEEVIGQASKTRYRCLCTATRHDTICSFIMASTHLTNAWSKLKPRLSPYLR